MKKSIGKVAGAGVAGYLVGAASATDKAAQRLAQAGLENDPQSIANHINNTGMMSGTALAAGTAVYLGAKAVKKSKAKKKQANMQASVDFAYNHIKKNGLESYKNLNLGRQFNK
jgi:hypothetical protein